MRTAAEEQMRYTWLRPAQVAQRIGCSTSKARDLIRRGVIESRRLDPDAGRPTYLVHPTAVDRYLANAA